MKLNKKEPKYSVGDEVSVEVSLDSSQSGALVGVCVADESVLEMVSKRKQVPRLPVMVYFAAALSAVLCFMASFPWSCSGVSEASFMASSNSF